MRVLALVIGMGLVTAGVIRADDTSRVAGTLDGGCSAAPGQMGVRPQRQRGYPSMVRREVKDNTMGITFYADGSIRSACTVEFKLEMKGAGKVFRCFNGKTTKGLGKDLRFGNGSFAYTVEGDTWTEIGESGRKVGEGQPEEVNPGPAESAGAANRGGGGGPRLCPCIPHPRCQTLSRLRPGHRRLNATDTPGRLTSAPGR